MLSLSASPGEAIKWPELGNHGEATHALPTHRTGGAGFETSSEVNLTRPDSRAGSIAPSAAASAVDLYGAQQDPYSRIEELGLDAREVMLKD